jgi:hypothetical protein
MADRFESRADLLAKIEWEGGVVEAYDYGIGHEEMPEGDTELTELWKQLEEAQEKVEPIARKIEKLLDDTVLRDEEK